MKHVSSNLRSLFKSLSTLAQQTTKTGWAPKWKKRAALELNFYLIWVKCAANKIEY